MPARTIRMRGRIRRSFRGWRRGPDSLRWEIVLADYDWLRSAVQPKLWYIPKGKEWRYKTNALNAMRNSGDLRYLPVIRKACGDESPEVREMAQWVLDEIEKSSGTSEQ